MERLRQSNLEVQQEMGKCREREAELLSFTQMLTEKNVAIQSELTGLEARVQQQDIDLTSAKVWLFTFIPSSLCSKDQALYRQQQAFSEISFIGSFLLQFLILLVNRFFYSSHFSCLRESLDNSRRRHEVFRIKFRFECGEKLRGTIRKFWEFKIKNKIKTNLMCWK